MATIIFDGVETMFVMIFLGFGWSSSLPFLKVYSLEYWLICGLTTAYLLFLFIKIYWKASEYIKSKAKSN